VSLEINGNIGINSKSVKIILQANGKPLFRNWALGFGGGRQLSTYLSSWRQI